jgi:hypothetical protein
MRHDSGPSRFAPEFQVDHLHICTLQRTVQISEFCRFDRLGRATYSPPAGTERELVCRKVKAVSISNLHFYEDPRTHEQWPELQRTYYTHRYMMRPEHNAGRTAELAPPNGSIDLTRATYDRREELIRSDAFLGSSVDTHGVFMDAPLAPPPSRSLHCACALFPVRGDLPLGGKIVRREVGLGLLLVVAKGVM